MRMHKPSHGKAIKTAADPKVSAPGGAFKIRAPAPASGAPAPASGAPDPASGVPPAAASAAGAPVAAAPVIKTWDEWLKAGDNPNVKAWADKVAQAVVHITQIFPVWAKEAKDAGYDTAPLKTSVNELKKLVNGINIP